jgi:hypothetical protein
LYLRRAVLTKPFLKPFLGMSVAAKSSYLSRFTIKLFEMVAAGIATAVSGYLVAHLGGYLFSAAPAPAPVQVAPATGGASKAASASPRVQPARAASADAGEKRHASTPDVGPAAAPVRTTATATPTAVARKPVATDTNADASKAGDEDTVEAQVRAALANVDASRPAPVQSAAPPHQADAPPAPVAVAVPPPADSAAGAGAVEVAPRAADLAPQPVQQAPAQPDPLTTVEIKSRPVVDVGALPATAPAQKDAQENTQDDSGLLSAIKHIPDLLRASSPATDGDPPRPPRPVGN